MKKLIFAFVISAFGITSAAAHACEGMKGHEKAQSGEQAKKDGKKDSAKNDQKS